MPCAGAHFAFLFGLWQLMPSAPALVEFELDSWQNPSPGWHELARSVMRGTAVSSSSGSQALRATITSYRYYFVEAETRSVHVIYDRQASTSTVIDHDTRRAIRDTCRYSLRLTQPSPVDADCLSASRAVTGYERLGINFLPDVTRLASRIRYRFAPGFEVDFAPPEEGCRILESRRTRYWHFLPNGSERFRVVRVLAGEPPAHHFQPPPGIQVISRSP